MGKKTEEALVPINALIPKELKRRLLVAKANTGKTIQALLVEWITEGVARVERERH